MTRARRLVTMLLGIGLLAAWSAEGEAQRGPPRGRGPEMQNRERLMLRFREQFSTVVREQLDLSEEEADRLDEVVRRFDDERVALAREEQAVRRRVEALLLEGGGDDEEAQELLARMRDLRAQESRVFAEEQEQLLEVLTPGKVLRFMALRERMAERLRALRRGGPPGRSGGAGDGRPSENGLAGADDARLDRSSRR